MWKMREMVDKATNLVMNYTETEAKVREATNDDPWGPSGAQMQEIASYTFTYEQFPEVMGMLWKRMLQDNRTNWRRTYKSLLLLDYLIKNGSERVVTNAREHVYDLRSMENYAFVDDNGKDQGVNIRHKVSDMIEFIQDDDRLRDERKKAKKNKDKYVGMSSDAMGFRGNSRSSGGFGGFDSGGGGGTGWKDSWQDTSSGPSGFKDHSDDDGSRGPSPDVSEFRDDDFNSPSSQPSSLSSNKFSDTNVSGPASGTVTSRPSSTSSTSRTQSKANKPKKTIDLGAAAKYAASQATSQGRPSKAATTQQNVNLFDDQPVQQQQPQKNVDLFNAVGEEDDFNPRGTNSKSDANANGDFGDFESAFGGSSTSVSNNHTNGGSNNGGAAQGFVADFSTAFGSTTPSANLPAPPTPPPSENVDLFGGGAASNPAPQGPSSNIDLLGGLVMNNPPPLMGMGSMGAMSQPQPQNDLFGTPVMSFGGQTQPQQPPMLVTANPGGLMSNNNFNTSSLNTSSTSAIKKNTLWDNVGNVNIDLDNLSLTGQNQKKPGLPMNAMVTPNSSPQKMGGAFAGGAASGPPPLQAVQSGSNSGFDSLNDLLN